MAAYSMSTLRTEIRSDLNEPTALLYSDTELKLWIDEAARKISILTLCNDTVEEVTADKISANAIEIALDTEFIRIHSVVYDTDTPPVYGLQRVHPWMLGHGGTGDCTAGTPRFWCQWTPDHIIIWPRANATVAADKMWVFGASVVDNYGADGSETLPDELQPLCKDYVLSLAHTKAGKHRLAAMYMQRFMQKCMIHRRDVHDFYELTESKDQYSIPDTIMPARTA